MLPVHIYTSCTDLQLRQKYGACVYIHINTHLLLLGGFAHTGRRVCDAHSSKPEPFLYTPPPFTVAPLSSAWGWSQNYSPRSKKISPQILEIVWGILLWLDIDAENQIPD